MTQLTKERAYKKLRGHFPTQMKFFWYRGVRLTLADFERIKIEMM